MEIWPGPVESGRGRALHALRWLAEAALLALVAAWMLLVLSQVVSLRKPLLRLPVWLDVSATVLTAAALWLAGKPRAVPALRGGAWFVGVMAVTGLLVGVAAVILGHTLAAREEPVTTTGLWIGFIVGAVVTFISLATATWRAWHAYTGTARKRFVALGVVAVMALAGLLLTARDPRWQLDEEGLRAKAQGLGRVDVLLVVDPHDPTGRALIAEANDHGDQLRRRPRDTARFDIAFGLAELSRPQDPPTPLYRTVLSPTSARANFVRALADIMPAAGPPAYGSYGRVLFDAINGSGVTWRDASRRAVVFVSSRPPSEAELDRRPGMADEQLEFATVLRAHQESILSGAGPLASGPRPSLAMYLVVPGSDPASGDWGRWTQATGGRVIAAGAYERTRLIEAIEDALTDSPVASARRLAERYRPYVNLATDERTSVVDVEQLLEPERREEGDRVCDRHRARRDDCVDIPSAIGLLRGPDGRLREQDQYIDFEEDVREAFHGKGPKTPPRMYFHIRRHDGLLHIGYWWYFPVNVSPVQVNETCLPGLTVGEFTCYDHEGDWEGVTVTLEPRTAETTPSGDPYNPAAFELRGWRPRSVTYDAHGRGIRWPWSRLAGTAALDASHPVVYAARGSHASYPLPCDGGCTQRLARSVLPEGPFDGDDTTRVECNENCLKPLPFLRRQSPFTRPAERDEDPVLWNAFPGRWGAALCLPVAQVCSQSDGPRTPSRQDRYRRPWVTLEPGSRAMREFARRSREDSPR